MPDITMCSDSECPSRESCYRFTAKANEYRQAYADFKHDADGKCSFFIEAKAKSQIRRLEAQTRTDDR